MGTLAAHGGVWGVELFFVLSGFLIGGILLKQETYTRSAQGLGLFYFRRMCRILPMFWLALVGNVLLEVYFRHHPPSYPEIIQHGLLIRNFSRISLTFFPESWSLAVEEWFYLLFPACLYLVFRLTRGHRDRVFLVCACSFYLASLALRVAGASEPNAQWSMGQRCTVIYRFDSIMTGVAAAWFYVKYPTAWRRHAVLSLAAGIALSVTAYALFWKFDHFNITEAPDTFFAKTFRFNLLSLGFALLLPAASLWRPTTENGTHLVTRKIALWSYSLYLVHWPLIQLISAIPAPALHPSTLTFGFFAIKILLAVGLSALLFTFFEAPTTRLRDRWRRLTTGK